jgi:hypothetical protein
MRSASAAAMSFRAPVPTSVQKGQDDEGQQCAAMLQGFVERDTPVLRLYCGRAEHRYALDCPTIGMREGIPGDVCEGTDKNRKGDGDEATSRSEAEGLTQRE